MKKFRFTLWVAIALVATIPAYSQNYDAPLSVTALAIGGQQLFISDAFSASGNPARCAMYDDKSAPKFRFGIMVRNQFLMNTLKNGGAGVSVCINKTDGIGFNLQYEGTSNLKRNTFVMAYAKRINNRVFLGVSLYYLNLFEQTIGNKNLITGKAGLYFQSSKKVAFGLSIFNPFATKLTLLTSERIPTNMISGLSYEVSKQLKCYISYRLGLHEANNLMLGMSYSSQPMLLWYMGCSTFNDLLNFGVRIKLKSMELQLSMSYQQRLGISPAVGFDWGR